MMMTMMVTVMMILGHDYKREGSVVTGNRREGRGEEKRRQW
jgi:hypothetical protein